MKGATVDEARKRMAIQLTSDQRRTIERLLLGESLFVTGQGGTGKTHIVREFVRRSGKRVAVTSTTGVSAVLLPGGTTLHSWAGIGLGEGSEAALSTRIRKKSYLKRRWKEVQVLIIDEVSMLSPDLFDKLESIARTVRGSRLPFGGIQVVLSGDFLQLPCVKSDRFCFEAETWGTVVGDTVILNDNMRQAGKNWQSCLSSLRTGITDAAVRETLARAQVRELTNPHGILPTRLYALRADVAEINVRELEKLSGEVFQFEADLRTYDKKRAFLGERLARDCPAEATLQLIVGCQVMLVCNLDIEAKLVNGSRGVVERFTAEDLPIVRFLDGTTRIVDYHLWELEEKDTKIASFEQIPLRLAYAVTIHRAQGLSLDYVVVDLSSVFEYGQGYVALSRVRSEGGLRIEGEIRYNRIKASPKALAFYGLGDDDPGPTRGVRAPQPE